MILNSSSNRTLPFTKKSEIMLLQQLHKQQSMREVLGDSYINNDYVCTLNNGSGINDEMLKINDILQELTSESEN